MEDLLTRLGFTNIVMRPNGTYDADYPPGNCRVFGMYPQSVELNPRETNVVSGRDRFHHMFNVQIQYDYWSTETQEEKDNKSAELVQAAEVLTQCDKSVADFIIEWAKLCKR